MMHQLAVTMAIILIDQASHRAAIELPHIIDLN